MNTEKFKRIGRRGKYPQTFDSGYSNLPFGGHRLNQFKFVEVTSHLLHKVGCIETAVREMMAIDMLSLEVRRRVRPGSQGR